MSEKEKSSTRRGISVAGRGELLRRRRKDQVFFVLRLPLDNSVSNLFLFVFMLGQEDESP